MKITIITVGEPKLHYAKEGFLEYIKRLQHFHKVEVIHIADNEKSETRIREKIKNTDVTLLDEKGSEYTSVDLAKQLQENADHGLKMKCYIIGGADGHSESLKKDFPQHWALSKLTFPHDLAMMLTAEALYRASTINAGHPYHRK